LTDNHFIPSRYTGRKTIIVFLPVIYFVGLREGTMLLVEKGKVHLIGARNARIFKKGSPPAEIRPGEDLSFLL